MVRSEQCHLQGSGANANHRDDENKGEEGVRQICQPSEQTPSRASGLRLPVYKQIHQSEE